MIIAVAAAILAAPAPACPDLVTTEVFVFRPDRLLERYADAEKSGLKATVAEGGNVLEPFRLENVALLKGAK